MKKYFCITLLLVVSISTKAQLNYFLYLQTDNKQSFYVKINDKLLSSSGTGYLIIPKLKNGDYNITVGFPKDQWPQHIFSVNIANNDVGYHLKNFGEKGWGLFNIQTLETTMAGTKLRAIQKPVVETDEAFTDAVSGKETLKVNESNSKTVVTAPKEMPAKELPAAIVETSNKPFIEKVKSNKTVNDYTVQYISHTNGNNDTINVEIPIENKKTSTKSIVAKTEEKITEDKPAKESKFLDIELQNPNAKANLDSNKKTEEKNISTADLAVNEKVEEQPKPVIIKQDEIKIAETPKSETAVLEEKKVVVATKVEMPKGPMVQDSISSHFVNKNKPVVLFNSDCKIAAAEEDFKKLRKKMAAETTDADMILVANKYFKTKCFSVEQIKNLSLLFLNEKGKYGFFDEAYPHTTDTQNFITLQSQLHEAYYVNRFKAMIGY